MTTTPAQPSAASSRRSVRHAVVVGSALHDTLGAVGPFTSQTEADLYRRGLLDTGAVEPGAAWVVPLAEPADPGWRISAAERQRRRDRVLIGDLVAGLDRDEVRLLADAAAIAAAVLYRVDAMYAEPHHPRTGDIERLHRLVGLLRTVNDTRDAIEQAHATRHAPDAPDAPEADEADEAADEADLAADEPQPPTGEETR